MPKLNPKTELSAALDMEGERGSSERTLRALPPLRLGEVLLRGAGVGEEQRVAPSPTPSPSPSAALGGADEDAGGEATMATWRGGAVRWGDRGEETEDGGWGFKWRRRGSR